VLTDGGDEAIDGSVAQITVEDTIIYNVRDRAYTDDSGSAHATFRNCLIFGNGGALSGSGGKTVINSTVYGGGGIAGSGHLVEESILWPQTLDGCPGTFNYNLLGAGTTVECGEGNFSSDPEFIKTSRPDYNFDLQPTSPAVSAGPNGERIGWLGFPAGATCGSDADCDDSNGCTDDTCSSGACRNDSIVGCVSCDVDEDCARAPQCVGACTAGACVYAGTCDDGLSCTTGDTCVGGFCVGTDTCPEGQECNFAVDACTRIFTTLSFQQGADGYSGTADTYIFQYLSDQSFGDSDLVEWDGQESTAPPGEGMIVGLIRFDDIFGTEAGQISVSSYEISSATLEYTTEDIGDYGDVREALSGWDEQVTWGGFGAEPGLQPDDYGPRVALAPGAPPGGGLSTSTVDVTQSIRRWADEPSQNKGWVLLPTGDNGSEFWSSEYSGDVTARPKLVVVYGGDAPLPNVVRQPYLQMATPTSMTVVWKTALESDSRVSFGTGPGLFDQTVIDPVHTTDHEVTVTGLTPDTTYYYEVGSADEFHAGGCTEHYFTTPPPIGTSAHFRTWVFGDSGAHTVMQFMVRDALLNEAGSHPPDVIAHVGDVDQGIPTAEDYTLHHFEVYEEVLSHTVIYPTVGNHDGYTSNSSDATGPYFDAFVLPSAGECGGLASGTESYYSYDHANVHFVALDSEEGNLDLGSPMLTWLQADLAATEQQWLFAYWHHPPYSKGSHDSDHGGDSEGRLLKMRENVVPLLEAGGVDLVFAGHSHLYERSYLVNGVYGFGGPPDYPTPDFSTLLATGNIVDAGDGHPYGSGAYVKTPFLNGYEGAVYMTAGTGGYTLDALPSQNHPVMFYTDRRFGSLLVDIDGNVLTVDFVRDNGTVADSFSIVKPCSDNADCDDGNVCTDDSCDLAGGCVFTHNVIPCDDDDACTQDDVCSGGNCSGTPVILTEVENVRFHPGAVMTWGEQGEGVVFDVASGLLADLQVDGGVSAAECLQDGVGEAGFTDPRPDPAPATSCYYLLRARNACGAETYGFTSAGPERLLAAGCP